MGALTEPEIFDCIAEKTMGALTEPEIFDCIAENLRIAAEDCRKLAWHPQRGLVYDRFRKCLGLVEGACRQAYYWRDYDARWLNLARQMGEVHKRAGNWLRGPVVSTEDGALYTGGSKTVRKIAHPLFHKLAEVLEVAYRHADQVRTMATFQIGPIMPEVMPGPHRDTRPVSVILPVTRGGIILPR